MVDNGCKGIGAPSQKASSPSGVAQSLLNPRTPHVLTDVGLSLFAHTQQAGDGICLFEGFDWTSG